MNKIFYIFKKDKKIKKFLGYFAPYFFDAIDANFKKKLHFLRHKIKQLSRRNEMKEYKELDRNGSLVYVEDRETGERDWVDYRDVDGWIC
jgi:hypothetical protein